MKQFDDWSKVKSLYESKKPLFDLYEQKLLKWNQKINLTSITDHQGILEKHFYDALVLFLFIDSLNVSRETFKLIDIGTGNGIPGLILKLANPSWQVTLLDSDLRKCDFLKFVSREMKLMVVVEHVHLDLQKPLDDTFDMVVSRAAFKMTDLIHFSDALLKPRGSLVCMKNVDQRLEMDLAESHIHSKGFQKGNDMEYALPHFSKPMRHIYSFEKP